MPPRRANSPRPATSVTGEYPRSNQVAQQLVQVEPRAGPQLAGPTGQVVGRDRVLEERLDASDQDPGPTARASGKRGDAGGRLVGHELAPLVGQGGPGLEDRNGRGIAEPRAQLLGHSVADLRVAGDPDERARRVASAAAR